MTETIINDAREYLLALFEVTDKNNSIDMTTSRYLGTGFLVSPKGDAITAAHVLPIPDQLPENRRIVAALIIDGKTQLCWVNKAAVIDQFDVALFQVNLTSTKYLEISSEEIFAGTDIMVVGFPSDQTIGKGLGMRVLKGHITATHQQQLELNFAVPAGMSGAPVFLGRKVIGYATGRVRSEKIEDQTEELIELKGNVEKIEFRTTSSITYYGRACALASLNNLHDPVFDGHTLTEFIAQRKLEA